MFQRAQKLLEEKTFNSFVTRIIVRSKEIIEENERILASERNKEIFFNSVLGENH